MARPRFTADAAERMRAAIQAAGGIEIFCVGQVDERGKVADFQVHCRGTSDSVPALLSRPKPGEVVIHNHPSGVVEASPADLNLAGRFGEDGVGVVIVDNVVSRDLWVVEPHRRQPQPVTAEEVREVFEVRLPRVLPGYEARGGQVEMAIEVARTFSEGGIAVLEAGTGTGKSLAYLVPSVLWALKNESRVAVATYTISLQAQLASDDLPLLKAAGFEFEYAVMKGRSNYICRRKLAETMAELGEAPPPGTDEAQRYQTLHALARHAEQHREASRSDLSFPVDAEVWDEVQSDHDQTLRARCPHFDRCFYYEARRQAAKAQLIVVNHHLLLADLAVKKDTGGDGVLPRFQRLVLDEGHHLEDAATSLFQEQVTSRAVLRATAPLLGGKKRMGALDLLAKELLGPQGVLPEPARSQAQRRIDGLKPRIEALRGDVRAWMEQLAADALQGDRQSHRLTRETCQGSDWHDLLVPTLQEAGASLRSLADELSRLESIFEQQLPEDAVTRRPQPFFDLRRAIRRLGEQASVVQTLQQAEARAEGPPAVNWIARARGRQKVPTAVLCTAPVDVGPLLRERVFEALDATVVSSATLTVGGRFEHFLERTGLTWPPADAHPTELAAGPPWRTAVLPSPFDYSRQALLGIPRDLPDPSDGRWTEEVARVVNAAIQTADGGVFVLCTSFSLLDRLHASARRTHGDRWPLYKQGEMGRARLLQQFRASGNGVLFGTDSFWEGVSVKGDALRLVIIPRLPFRVPTEPVQQARHEHLVELGLDPFRGYSLPQAVLRFRQGFGRLIRTRSDRGAVLVLDRRIVSKWYGRVFLASLPQLDRATGPSRAVLERLARFYAQD